VVFIDDGCFSNESLLLVGIYFFQQTIKGLHCQYSIILQKGDLEENKKNILVIGQEFTTGFI
jgi:hypothetical protein